VLGRFLQACGSGDLGALKSMLREDAVSYSDGGGKVAAGINPIFGADKVIRLIDGLRHGLRQKQGPGDWSGYLADVNGEPGFVYTLDGNPWMVTTLDLDESGRIRAIYGVLNPDKLPGV
jgi:RNA polymerase sigma-70 factor (ECF subfamily)